ncbi:MAG: OmpA family protein [Myxococcota bacterium]
MSEDRPVPMDDSPEDSTRPATRTSRIVPAPASPPGDEDEGYVVGTVPIGAPPTLRRSKGGVGLVPWIILLVVLAIGAFFTVSVHRPLREELEQTKSELEQERRNSLTLERQVETLQGSQAKLAAELEAEMERRQREVDALQSTQEELASKLAHQIERGNVLIKQVKGELVVDLVDRILFDSGEAEINDGGKEVLRQVGETFIKLQDKLIQVAGHTDAVPIASKLVDEFPTNWELSVARATQIVRFLEEEVKIPGQRLAIVGRSQYAPVATNATKAGRRKNRRIEVTLVPMAGKKR